MFDNNNLITARTLADELGLSIETIWRYTREKRIPYIKLGSKQYRYRLSDVKTGFRSCRFIRRQERYILFNSYGNGREYCRSPNLSRTYHCAKNSVGISCLQNEKVSLENIF
ncbi:MAG: helix-turn-helix domain-containing protein [Clostridiales bacterium]|nr:helix-turn-helix domain-containing protein [Clostridiales bacterium]